MPVAHDPDGRRRLVAGGTAIGRFDEGARDGVPMADLFDREPGVGVEQAASAVLDELRGWRIAADEELGRALLAAGGALRRHGHSYSYDLRRDRPSTWDTPPDVRLTDINRPVRELIPSRRAAYPPDHPDHGSVPEDMLSELDRYVHGGEFGPLLRGSGLAVLNDAVVGGIILATVPGDPPRNGPWIIDVWRDPALPGVGRALLQRALALAPVDTLGLLVTDGNDAARRRYEELGFRLRDSRMVVQL
ncbi:MAG TPA: GNAT family N-acetyltransferase [Solirubrobacteraceae bacterium]|nr:GNAT family N-acetyltransferase [Solirubrobacteraceae bacterium]